MKDDKTPTNLVSIDCGKKEEEVEAPYQERLVEFLEECLEKAIEGELTHLAMLYEGPDGTAHNAFMGLPCNSFYTYYILNEVLPESYKYYYLNVDSGEEG